MSKVSLYQSFSPRHGDGSLNTLHLVAAEDIAKGRFKRKAGDALCKPAARFWMLEPVSDAQINREVDGFLQWGCKACAERAAKLRIDVNELRSQSPRAAATAPAASGWVAYGADDASAQPVDYGWVWADVGGQVRPLYYGSSNHSIGPWYIDDVASDLDEDKAYSGEVLRWMTMTMPSLDAQADIKAQPFDAPKQEHAKAHEIIRNNTHNDKGEAVYRVVDEFEEGCSGVQVRMTGDRVHLMQKPMTTLLKATEQILSHLHDAKIIFWLVGEGHHEDGRVEQCVFLPVTPYSPNRATA